MRFWCQYKLERGVRRGTLGAKSPTGKQLNLLYFMHTYKATLKVSIFSAPLDTSTYTRTEPIQHSEMCICIQHTCTMYIENGMVYTICRLFVSVSSTDTHHIFCTYTGPVVYTLCSTAATALHNVYTMSARIRIYALMCIWCEYASTSCGVYIGSFYNCT